MIQLVLDTNVLVSGMINAHGAPGRIVDLVREGAVELVVDDRVLNEYSEVLSQPEFRAYFGPHQVRDIIQFLEQNTHYTVSTVQLPDLPDPTDAPFLELAMTAAVPLVTGNTDHFPPERCRPAVVFTPAQFLDRLKATGRATPTIPTATLQGTS